MQQILCFMNASAAAAHESVAPAAAATATLTESNISVDRLPSDVLNLAITVVFVILFLRTAAPTLHSRYLKHLAGVYALIGLFYVSSIALMVLKLVLYFSARGQQSEIATVFANLEKVGELIKLIFSSLSSCFLVLTWYLLWHYPDQGISKGFYGTLFAAYVATIPALEAVAQMFGYTGLSVLDVTDSTFASIGVIMVGTGLCRLVWIQQKSSRPVRDVTAFGVAAAFLCWALPQPLFTWYQGVLWFWLLLAAGKVIAGLAALLVSVVILQPKSEFRT
jgi:hypothetical protein